MFMGSTAHVNAYRKFGQDCRDITCAPTERCILSNIACEKDQQNGEHCGLYPKCMERSTSADQQYDRFTIDSTANTRSSINAPISSPITSTIQLNTKSDDYMDTDSGFEFINSDAGANSVISHADQRQTNVLVIVQDGTWQPNQNPNPNRNPNFNYNRQPWRQPCITWILEGELVVRLKCSILHQHRSQCSHRVQFQHHYHLKYNHAKFSHAKFSHAKFSDNKHSHS
ncbi:GH14486 [Drosophila grimshawi]|uniref:GH14486 n=1 Tax=Drosophila grimshawi TaxID=7222 RepID=B4J020_DROGR|nr:GH14486 [Drosophila grimshawi]